MFERSSSEGRWPLKDKRLTCMLVLVDLGVGGGRLLSSCLVEELVLPLTRLLLVLTVTLFGINEPLVSAPIRGDPLGVVAPLGVFALGGGSFERTECTLSSIFCILPIKPLIWYSELDLGTPSEPTLGRDWRVVRRLPEAVVAVAKDGPRE